MIVQGIELPDSLGALLEPTAPVELRLGVARGAVPLPPGQRLSSLALLLTDPDEAVCREARAALEGLPQNFVSDAVGDPLLPGLALDAVAQYGIREQEILWKVLQHPALLPATVERFLDSPDEAAVSRLAHNQRALDKCPELGRRLLDNPLLHPGERSRLHFLYGGPEDDPIVIPLDDEPLPADLPPELLEDERFDSCFEADDEPQAIERVNLYQLVQSLSVSDKIKLAMLGSKGARRLLMRDTNKLVSVAVIRSPKIREDEVLVIAQDRTTSDEVLRIIMNRKDWLKSYPVRLALTQNPKTPAPRALRLLETLQERDLRNVAKSRNVGDAIARGAARILSRRGKL